MIITDSLFFIQNFLYDVHEAKFETMQKSLVLSLLSLFLLAACGAPVDSTPAMLGQADAKVLIEEFSDPQCPACASISPQVEQFVRDNPTLAYMKYYHFPLTYHEYAFLSAQAIECARDQDKFWEFLDNIFATQAQLNEDHLYNVADGLGLDRTAFDACLDNGEKKGIVYAHMAEGAKRRVNATPSLYINGQLIQWSGAETLKAYIESL